MEWISSLSGKTIGIDTAPFIYYIEENATYFPLIEPLFQAIADSKLEAVTSVITLLEVLVKPLREQRFDLAGQYRHILLNSRGLTIAESNTTIADRAAHIRAEYNIRTPDAIQIATAILNNASVFLTNDSQLPKIEGIEIVKLDELVSTSK
ncbi:MAG: PIN domain-containing protein [Candidatus Obscuribacterales bacterium]|nr:PIN domain-containing protein [Candidatus Obscuribacterales bacterium]